MSGNEKFAKSLKDAEGALASGRRKAAERHPAVEVEPTVVRVRGRRKHLRLERVPLTAA